MASETTKIGDIDRRENGPIRATMARLGKVVEMGFELLDLQARLAKQDASTAGAQVKPAVASVIFAMALLLSGLPLLAFGLASVVSHLADIPVWLSQILVATGCLAISGLLLGYAWRSLTKATRAFEASRLEAVENLQWFRRTIDELLR